MNNIENKNMLRIVLNKLGYKENEIPYKPIIYNIIGVIVLIGTTIDIFINWDNIIIRFTAIKDLNVSITVIIFASELIFKPNHIWSLMKIIEYNFNINNNKYLNKNKIDLIIENKKVQNFYFHNMFYLLFAIIIILIFVPLSITIYVIYINNINEININKLPLPIAFWIPEYLNNFKMYFFIYILLSFNLVIIPSQAYTVVASLSGVAQSIIIDIKLQCISIKEIDRYIKINNKIDFNQLKLYTDNLIIQHQIISR